jgi:hypothetical protein
MLARSPTLVARKADRFFPPGSVAKARRLRILKQTMPPLPIFSLPFDYKANDPARNAVLVVPT